jgi:hypothetical protein
MEVEHALIRLREATAEINRATDDARMKATLEKTWILQDRLVFPNQVLSPSINNGAVGRLTFSNRDLTLRHVTEFVLLAMSSYAGHCMYAGRPRRGSTANT